MDFLLNNSLQGFNFYTGGVFFIVTVWSLLWKGAALWTATKNNEKYWFVALLILNTVGILEIIYLFIFAKKKLKVQDILPGLKNFFQR